MGAAALSAVGATGYALVVRGDLVIDTGVGRRVRPLGPLSVDIDAPRATVFDIISAPYLGRPTRAMAEKIEVLERSDEMVLAAHRTPVSFGLVATTMETVRFERPHTVSFRLLRGPVPHVVERFELLEVGDGATQLNYTGELGTDFGRLGSWWGDRVAGAWVDAVRGSFQSVKDEAERRHRGRAKGRS